LIVAVPAIVTVPEFKLRRSIRVPVATTVPVFTETVRAPVELRQTSFPTSLDVIVYEPVWVLSV
jgi:hypothetical protein